MKGRITLHLMMLVSITLCNMSSLVVAAGTSLAAESELSGLSAGIFLAAPLPEDEGIELCPPDKTTGEPVNLRSKRFEWLAHKDTGIAEEEPFDALVRTPHIKVMTVV